MVELLYISMVSSKKQLLLDIKAGAFGCLIESINFQDAEHVSEINVECIKLMLAFRRVLNPILLAESRKQKAESRKQKAESRKQKAESRKQKAESRKQKARMKRKARSGLI
ncbi:hypothetical protein TOI97_05515 [Denitrificimonas sp. JX-1]|uniref:Uncharacterized protein n=1 Tax=Denitrificimonas halotolerans TaxID=3098930 RepID=A0ABU5GRM8_9GAMM|nr:hypothetical protein [Denitrificimonas sp. JX-1]MDY7219030.1 hypothetical protein [Denitrificimonas sp. JX-1]